MSVLGTLLTTSLPEIANVALDKPFDAVIVGAGSTGITVARTLAEGGQRVALLDAGPLALLGHVQSTDLRFDATQVRALQTSLQYSPPSASGKTFGSLIGCIGGRGLFWNGAAPRFQASDFDGWPVRLEEMEAYYLWAERVLNVSRSYAEGRLSAEVCARLAQAGIRGEPGPYAVDAHANRDGWLGGTVGNSLGPLLRTAYVGGKDRPIMLAQQAFGRRIMHTDGKVTGIETVDLQSDARVEIKAGKVVLAAGGFESVRLALVSELPDPNRLIGKYISDHIFCRAYFPAPVGLYRPDVPEVGIVWVASSASSNYQLELHLPADNMFALQPTQAWNPDKTAPYSIMVRGFAPARSRPENFIEALSGDGPGRFRVNMTLSAEDLQLREVMIGAIQATREALGADAADIQIMPEGASHHEAGGLKFGDDPATSVCDSQGRMRALQGLYVADASVWPTVAPANPHLTIIALARRAGQALLKDMTKVK